MPTLYRNGVVHSRTDPFAEALLVADGRVAWLGEDASVGQVIDAADEVVDLDGALVTPGFVDAHVHLLDTGLALEGVDVAGLTDTADVLAALAGTAARLRAGAAGPVLATGWLPGPDGGPTAEQVAAACQGAPVVLVSADGGTALVSAAAVEATRCDTLLGWSADGTVRGPALAAVLAAVRDVDPSRRAALHDAALRAAAAAGIVAVHEQSTPDRDTRAGLAALLAATVDAGSGLPLVLGFRAELCETSDDARALLEEIPGLAGIGGDLAVDGPLAAGRAALRAAYADAPSARGSLLLTAEAVTNHVAAVTRAGSRASLRVHGDHALDEALLAFRAAGEVEGAGALRAAGHRIEGAPLVDAGALAQLVLLGVTIGAQPAADQRVAALVRERLGAARASALSPWADLAASGVPVVLGSGAPRARLDPWAAVRAVIEHPEPSQRVSARSAFRAHTRGGWRSVGLDGDGSGEIRVGAPADLAFWHTGPLAVQAPEGRLAAWSTDPRAGTPLLPELGAGLPEPRCVRTLRRGVVLHDLLG